MAMTACIPTQAKADFLAGVHLAAGTSTAGTWTLQLPAVGATAIIRMV